MDELFESSQDSSYADYSGGQAALRQGGVAPAAESLARQQSEYIPTAHVLSIRLVAMRARATQKGDMA